MSSACIRLFGEGAATSRPEDIPGQIVSFHGRRWIMRVFDPADWHRLAYKPHGNVVEMPTGQFVWFQPIR